MAQGPLEASCINGEWGGPGLGHRETSEERQSPDERESVLGGRGLPATYMEQGSQALVQSSQVSG